MCSSFAVRQILCVCVTVISFMPLLPFNVARV